MAQGTILLPSADVARSLFGPQDEFLNRVQDTIGADIVLRGDRLRILGTDEQIERGRQIIASLQAIIDSKQQLQAGDVEQVLKHGGMTAEERAALPGFSGSTGGRTDIQQDQSSADEAAATEAVSQTAESLPVDAVRDVLLQSAIRGAEPQTLDSAPDTERFVQDRLTDADASQGFFDEGRSASIGAFNELKARSYTSTGVKPRTKGQRNYLEAIRSHEMVFCEGPAGCGKTFLAVAMALEALRREEVRKIVLVRPAVEAGEKLGFLPGDMLAKVNPFLRPLLDAIHDLLDFDVVRRYLANDVIEIVPLAFMRGRTLNDTFMILDEAQNTTVTQMKMFLTRMGLRSRVVVTGDATQNDLPDNATSGLNDALNRLHLIDGVAIVKLTGQDIVRHELVRRVVSAYEATERGDQRLDRGKSDNSDGSRR